MTSRRLRATAVIAAIALTAPLLVNAAPQPRHTGFCDSFLSFLCPKDDPAPEDPAPGPTPTPGEDEQPAPEETPEAEQSPAPEDVAPVEADVDDGAPVFSGIPSSMRSGGLSFTGLRGISIVQVPTADGDTVRALKISADSITISGFALTVRPPDGPGLVTTADTMSLRGHVSVYLGSVTASLMGGQPITLGTDTPPPLDQIRPGLLDVTMGLIGSSADSISYSDTDQNIVELEDQ